jgi:hypothetical protein
MRLIYKEDPKEWRKSALLTSVGLTVISFVLRWRHVITTQTWTIILLLMASVAACACLRPGWFRLWYRFSIWLGFVITEVIGRLVLAIFFILIITPLGLLLRAIGKDLLSLRRPRGAFSYWHTPKDPGPLDRLF